MNNNFNELREKYNTFIYKKYLLETNNNILKITFTFEIPNLTTFNPYIEIPLNNQTINIDDPYINYLSFHIGLIEMISYFKCVCSPQIIIEADYINEEQIKWFKKLIYFGLGEFLYTNNININEEDLTTIICNVTKKDLPSILYEGTGNLIPIGGGKDSCVTLELLKDYKNINHCFIINPKEVTLECAKIAGYNETNTIGIKRVLDKQIIELNKQGFLNGHTPFSSLVAFISYLTAYIYKKKYITLSNEASANEPTIPGTKINHQYSKTFEFEQDFNEYTKKYFKINIKYFSLLRPLTEYQIGMLFSKYEQYHNTFKSCNIGSKTQPWEWCGKCPKCLFVYTILSPYLYKEKLVNIFKKDLFEDKELLNTLLELSGNKEIKPFECVGTTKEVRYALSKTINKLDNLPYLLQYYKDNYPLELEDNYEIKYNKEHNLPKEYEDIIKKEIS